MNNKVNFNPNVVNFKSTLGNSYFYTEMGIPIEGYFDKDAIYWIIRKKDAWKIDLTRNFMSIGGPGADGIEFGLKKGLIGFWVYYPIDNEYIKVADSFTDFIDKWKNGDLKI